MPTVAELNALPYTGPSSFAEGLTAADYRAQYALHGEAVRWFKAFHGADYHPGTDLYDRSPNAARDKNGRIYVEQTTCDDGSTLVADARVMVYNTHDEIHDNEFGLLPKGSTAISTMPDEIPLARLDRVILTGRGNWLRRQLVRAASGDDTIFSDTSKPVPIPVRSIKRVWQGTTVYTAGTHYTLVSGAVHWVSGGPAAGSAYAVEVTYSPVYTVVGSDTQPPRLDVEGGLLPLRMGLVKMEPGQ